MDEINKLRKLPIKLNEDEIKKVSYQYYLTTDASTDIRISEIDGLTVLIQSSTIERIEENWRLLCKIARKYGSHNSSTGKKDKILINNNLNPTISYDEIISSGLICQQGKCDTVICKEAADLHYSLDRLFYKFAHQEKAINLRLPSLWDDHDLHEFGMANDDPVLSHISFTNNAEHYYWQTAVCNNIWRFLKNSEISNPQAYTAKGTCCRNEANQIFLLERMRVFTMREIVYLGTPKEVTKFRERAINFTCTLVKELDLTATLTNASDPFFLSTNSNSNLKTKYNLPENIKYELQLKTHLKSIAAASFNIHGTFFADQYSIKHAQKNDVLWTACAAFGIERWIWAILSQHGTSIKQWPNNLRGFLNDNAEP